MTDATSSDLAVQDVPESVDDSAGTSTNDVGTAIALLSTNDPGKFFSSIKLESFEDRLNVLNAMTTSLPLDDNIGKPLNLRNFVVQAVSLTDAKGEVNDAPRCVLIDQDGTAYHATSTVILNDLLRIVKVAGEPASWPGAIPIYVSKERAKVGNYFTIKFGTPGKK